MHHIAYRDGKLSILLLISFLILIVYSNSFQASWQLDDKPNILQNPLIHINDLKLSTLLRTFFASPAQNSDGKNFHRPVSFFTFALNWYFGGTDVFGYHLVNIGIHILTSLLLFIVICLLLQATNIQKKITNQNLYLIAGLSTILWSINPIQTEAVIYIVQRMTLLAAFFYLAGIYFFLKLKISIGKTKRFLFLFLCMISYLLAIGAKENALMMPFSILLIEIVFFRKTRLAKLLLNRIWLILVIGMSVGVIGYLFFFISHGNPVNFISDLYSKRYFTLSERLLTEPRIVIKYITQIFYPIPQRFSIEHDILISTTLFHPWTTVPAILLIFGTAIISIIQIKKWPLLSFGILFFFLNHFIESSFLPLELIFEHRNYLPSFFIFLPVAYGITFGIRYYQSNKNYFMHGLLSVFTILLIIGFGCGTYARNRAWASEKTLWEDAAKKAPNRVRPIYNLAKEYYFPNGFYEIALKLYQKSLSLKSSKPSYSKALALNGMSHVYYVKRDYQKVIELCHKALSIDPESVVPRYNLLLALMKSGNWDEALLQVNDLLSTDEANSLYSKFKGIILIRRDQYMQALACFRKYLEVNPNSPEALMHVGFAFESMRMHEKAKWFYKLSLKQMPNNLMCLLCLIENQSMMEDSANVALYTTYLLKQYNLSSIEKKLYEISHDNLQLPISTQIIVPIIAKNIYTYSYKNSCIKQQRLDYEIE